MGRLSPGNGFTNSGMLREKSTPVIERLRMILLIDNYDSFVFNLARYFRELGCETTVVRNDELRLGDVEQFAPDAAILSPGPCSPSEAGISVEFVQAFWQTLPILGVCLGHQAIAAAFGGRIVRAAKPVHGQTSLIEHDQSELFSGLENPFEATRYHSLIIEERTLPAELSISARTSDGVPMAVRHCERPVYGVQFHPESILTANGHRLLRNFLHLAGLAPPHEATDSHGERPAEPPPEIAQLSEPLHW